MDYTDYEYEFRPKIPSLLSSHLDSPLRIHMIKYYLNNSTKIACRGDINIKYPKSYGFYLKDLNLLYNLNLITPSFQLMDSSCYGLLSSQHTTLKNEIHSLTLLEKAAYTASRVLELQLDKILNADDDDTIAFNESMNMKQKLKDILKIKNQLGKIIPFHIKHLFYWFKCLYQSVIMTGDPNDSVKLTEDLNKLNNSWQMLTDDSKIFLYSNTGLKLITSRNVFIIVGPDGTQYLGTREHLLLFTDIFIQRFNLMISGWFAEQIGFKHYLTPNELESLHFWGDAILSKLHNKAFDLLSKWEPLCLGSLMKCNPDALCDNTKFLSTIQKDLISEFSHIYPQIKQKLYHLEKLLYNLYKSSPHKLSQAFGLYRTWGHPNIDPRIGIIKLKQIACQNRVHNVEMTKKISCLFKEKLSLNFRMKKGMWPKMDVSKLLPNNIIRRAYETNSTLAIMSKYYNILDWHLVKFEKTFEIADKLNISDLISDKAMSLGIDELFKQVKEFGNIGLATDKAVIIQWLKSNLNDPIKFLMEIDEYGFGHMERIFGVCPKERELKIIARFFGLSTLLKRMYIVLTEAMIAEYIIPYFPQITMLDSQITLSKKLFEQTRDMSNHESKMTNKYINIITNIDFQKWNTYMREKETKYIFETMDNLFGLTNCIQRTHEMFSESQMYLADGTYIPQFIEIEGKLKLKEDDYVWSNHLGGIEGLRQKGWTIFTVCILIHVMENFPHRFSLMGQGDNQVLIVHFNPGTLLETIKTEHNKILDHLDDILKLIGPPLKREETWSSSNLFVYGKTIILNGCPLSMSQKKLCRMFPMSNEGFPTIETAISSVVANCSAACSSDINPIPAYWVHCVWNSIIFCHMFTFSYLGFSISDEILKSDNISYSIPGKQTRIKFNNQISKYHISLMRRCNVHLIVILLLFPKILGGFPISYLLQYLIKSFPDPLTESLSILTELFPRLNIFEKELMENLLHLSLNSTIQLEYLFANPVGVNLSIPTTPGDIVKRTVTRFIQHADWIKNDYVKEFLLFSENDQNELVEALSSMKPMNPIICHELLEATISGRAKSVIDQLNKTGTLIKIAAKHGDDLLSRVKEAECNYIKSSLYQLFNKGNFIIDVKKCSRIEAQRLRQKSWQNDSITGVTVPYPFEMLILEKGINCDSHTMREKGYILLKQISTNLPSKWVNGEIIGSAPPYIGSRTIDKVKSYGKQIAKSSAPLLKRAANLQSLIGWATERDSNLSECIKTIFSAITDLDPELLNPSDDSISGSIEHRLNTTSLDRGGKVELLFTFGTHISLSTDTFIAYSKGTQNVNLHFQAAMSYIVSLYSTLRSLNIGFFNTCYHFHQNCKDCIIPVNEDKIEIYPSDWKSIIPSYPNSSFCWISKEIIIDQSNQGCISYRLFPENHPIRNNIIWNQLRACRAAARETMTKMRIMSIEIGDGKQSSIGGWIFPVAWVFKLNPYVFFISYYLELFSYYLLRQFEFKMINENYTRINDKFYNFITGLDDGYLGVFSSWFQNNAFLDYICGSPFFLRPPLTSSITKRACGNCIKRMLLSIHDSFENQTIIEENFKYWQIILTNGEESLDSHPILMSLIYRHFLNRGFISSNNILTIYVSLKTLIPNLLQNSEFISSNLLNLIRQKYIYFRNSLSPTNLRYLLDHLRSINIFKVLESTDGVISKMNKFELECSGLSQESLNYIHLTKMHSEYILSQFSFTPLTTNLTYKPNLIENLPPISHINHLYKPINFPTTASYKLLSIVNALGRSFFDVNNIGCFGDGAGGFSRLMTMVCNARIFYNSLIDLSNLFPNALGNSYPPCFAGFPDLRRRLFGLRFTYEMMNDLSDSNYADMYINNVSQSLDIIMCDAEGKSRSDNHNSFKILINLLRLAKNYDSKCLIFKTYLYDWTEFLIQLSLVREVFQTISIIRSYFSSTNSTEVYLIAKNQTKDIQSNLFNFKYPNIVLKYTLSATHENELKCDLIDKITKSASEKASIEYSTLLTNPIFNYHSKTSLFSISKSLGKFIEEHKDDYDDLKDNQLFRFPLDYVMDCKKNTHLLRYNDKYNKITKINFITKSFARRIISGYLIILMLHPEMKYDYFENVFNHGAVLFYGTYKHFWNFIICPYSSLKDIDEAKFSFKELFTHKHKKEILVKTNLIKPYAKNLIFYDFEISNKGFPKYRIKENDGIILYHKGFTPLDIPKTKNIGVKIFKLPSWIYHTEYMKFLHLIQELWITNRKIVYNSQCWYNT